MIINYEELIAKALEMRKFSYVPYSNFAVGAALLSSDGQVWGGCNIESVSHTPTSCAERTAFVKAISSGVTTFVAIAVVGDSKEFEFPRDYCPPCGVCRQVMAEFCDGEFQVILAKSQSQYEIHKLSEILPLAFDNLKSKIGK